MALRSMASATISFGLVSIPVRLFPATQASAAISFNLLHAKCGSRVRQQYVCPADGEKVERDQLVKGYEFAPGQYVTFTPEELQALEEVASQAIEIAEFVPASEVDPVYFDRAYYLGPDRGASKAYRLLVEAMRRSGQAALGRYAARGKQYLVLLRPAQGRLVMQQLLHSDEVRPVSEVELDEAPVDEREVQLALRLVEQTAAAGFHPESYPDEVRRRTLALIDQKVQGKQIQRAPAEAARGQVIDLVEALKASLATTARRPPAGAQGIAPAPERAPGEEGRRPPQRAPRRAGGDRSRAAGKK